MTNLSNLRMILKATTHPTYGRAERGMRCNMRAFDKYVSAKVCIKQGDNMSYGTVKRRKRDSDGNLLGTSTATRLLIPPSTKLSLRRRN
jgi:hypothetical protein